MLRPSPQHTPDVIEPHGFESEKYTGYELLRGSFKDAAISFLDKIGLLERLANDWMMIPLHGDHNSTDRYLRGALEFLEAQWVLDRKGNQYKLRDDAEVRISGSRVIHQRVATYTDVMRTVEADLEWPTEGKGRYVYDKSSVHALSWLPAVLTILKETNLTTQLTTEPGVKLTSFTEPYLGILEGLELVEIDGDSVAIATKEGKAVLKQEGFAELMLSYFRPMSDLKELFDGDKRYGKDKDVNRQPTANALATNGILKKRVAPEIAEWIASQDFEAAVDYGCGGGDMTQQTLAKAPGLDFAIGMDIHPVTVKTARQKAEEAGIGEKARFIEGNITSEADMRKLAEALEGRTTAHVINFILHESPELANAFLALHAKIFPNDTLIVSESFKIPLEIRRAHPNAQASIFDFMHEISGQTLYEFEQLKKMLDAHGYEIVEVKTHSSIRNEENHPEEGRLPTIATFMCRQKSSH